MVNGNIGGAALEVRHGIATLHHQVADQPVGFDHDTGRVVDELGLKLAPGLGEPRRLRGRKRNDLQALDAFFPGEQFGLRLRLTAPFGNHPRVFRAEALSQVYRPLAALFAHDQPS